MNKVGDLVVAEETNYSGDEYYVFGIITEIHKNNIEKYQVYWNDNLDCGRRFSQKEIDKFVELLQKISGKKND